MRTGRVLGWGTRFRAHEWVDRSWIVIPSLYVAAALVLGKVVPRIEEHREVDPFALGLAPESAREILNAVASGMIAFTGLVVSVAVVVVQFGASQYTPRLVLRFRRDLVVKHALGIFVAPALYALVSLGAVGHEHAGAANLTVGIAIVLLVAAVFAFFALTARLLDLLRPRRLYAQLRDGCERAIDQVYPHPFAGEAADRRERLPAVTAVVPYTGPTGVLSALDHARLLELASAADATVEVAWTIGGFVWTGGPLFTIRGAGRELPRAELERAAIVAEERTLTQDPAFAIRTIVDIAIRALSPAVNDPTTAVQALDSLESLLHRLARRDLGAGHLHDGDGRLRVVYSAPGWEALLDLALTEIRDYGASSHQIARRLRAL
ncbi:MAG TPA: DUF2254 domain-containing protein, partial [Thermoleophilaceae bacterium]